MILRIGNVEIQLVVQVDSSRCIEESGITAGHARHTGDGGFCRRFCRDELNAMAISVCDVQISHRIHGDVHRIGQESDMITRDPVDGTGKKGPIAGAQRPTNNILSVAVGDEETIRWLIQMQPVGFVELRGIPSETIVSSNDRAAGSTDDVFHHTIVVVISDVEGVCCFIECKTYRMIEERRGISKDPLNMTMIDDSTAEKTSDRFVRTCTTSDDSDSGRCSVRPQLNSTVVRISDVHCTCRVHQHT